MDRQERAASARRQPDRQNVTHIDCRESPAAPAPGPPPQPPAAPPPPGSNGTGKVRATDEQLARLRECRNELFKRVAADATEEELAAQWQGILLKRGVTTARDLTHAQAEELTVALRHQLECLDLQEGLAEPAPF
jgi:hypothetical protein